MQTRKRIISKEVYDRAIENGGHIRKDDQDQAFTREEVLGYGVYHDEVLEENEEYYVQFVIGGSCE